MSATVKKVLVVILVLAMVGLYYLTCHDCWSIKKEKKSKRTSFLFILHFSVINL